MFTMSCLQSIIIEMSVILAFIGIFLLPILVIIITYKYDWGGYRKKRYEFLAQNAIKRDSIFTEIAQEYGLQSKIKIPIDTTNNELIRSIEGDLNGHHVCIEDFDETHLDLSGFSRNTRAFLESGEYDLDLDEKGRFTVLRTRISLDNTSDELLLNTLRNKRKSWLFKKINGGDWSRDDIIAVLEYVKNL